MPLLKAVADKLSNNELVAGVIDEIITRDELFALVPFKGVNGKAYVYNRENESNFANDTSTFAAPGDTVNESSSDFDTVTTTLKILIGDVDVDNFLQETESDTNDQKATQIALKAKYLGKKFRQALITGDSTVSANQFDGLLKMLTGSASATGAVSAVGADGMPSNASGAGDPTQNFIFADGSTNGTAAAPLTLDLLDELIDLVPNGPDALMMHSRSIRKLRALLRAAGGNRADMMEIENFGVPVFAYNGIPIIRNEYVPTSLTVGGNAATTAIFAMRLNELDGFHGIFGGSSAGIRVEDIGTVQNKDATRTRLKWYCGTALKSTKSAAGILGVL